MSLLWKNLSMEGCSGETHKTTTRGIGQIFRTFCLFGFQDGGGNGVTSREGIPVTHYPEHFKEEVVAFAKATSQKDAKER